MKKKTIANILMLAIIVVIIAAGVLGVGHIQGWFDTADGTQAVLCDMRGVLNLERDGVSYKVAGDTVLRAGDKITCDPGATTAIKIGNSTLVLGEKAELMITEPSVDGFAAEITNGEVFANCENAAILSFAEKEVTFFQTTAILSIRTGAQSVSVLRGSVADVSAGQVLNYISDRRSISTLDINSLNDFAITQIRAANETAVLCYTNADLDKLEADRQRALQDLINSMNPTQPEQTDPTVPDVTDPVQTDSVEIPGPHFPVTDPALPSQPEQTDPSAPSVTEPDQTEPTKPPVTPPSEPEPTEMQPAETEPELTDPPAAEPIGSCYITIRCDTILNNMGDLNPSKAGFVPSNGVILSTVSVTFTEGETVFDVLKRVCEKADIQLEYSWQAMFDTYYIEGINNLYEKDCGSESGWMYKVNGWFPNYGVSNYTLSDGDTIAFLYSCKGYGTDVGAPEYTG